MMGEHSPAMCTACRWKSKRQRLMLLLLPTAAAFRLERNAGVSQMQALPAQAPSADIAAR